MNSSNTTVVRASALIALVLVAGVLYLAKAVFVPLALALLLAFLLAPLIQGSVRRGVPRGVAVGLSVAVSFAVIVGMGAVILMQVLDLARKLPEYKDTIHSKLELLEGETKSFEGIGRLLALLDSPGAAAPPLRVEVVEGRLEVMGALIGPFVQPVLTAGLVLVFVVFMLLQWDDLRDRLLRLSGPGRLNVTTQALEEASRRVSHYLQMQLLINTMVGAAIGIGVWLIGIPNAALWGLLALIMRFVPYVGALIAAAFPIAVAFATTSGYDPALWTLALFVVVEVVASNVLEPWLYGSRTGLSAIGVIVSFVFWGWLWGGVGMLLATPLTVCLVVAGRHIQQLEIINVLFSDERALPNSARLYHRLLALDSEEAARIVAEAKAESATLGDFYDSVLVPALSMAERDRHDDGLNEERRRVVYGSLESFVEEHRPIEAREPPSRRVDVLCVSAGDIGDFLTARMARQVLDRAGWMAETLPEDSTLSEVVEKVALSKPRLVLITALPPMGTVDAHGRCKSLRDLFPDLPVIVGAWKAEPLQPTTVERLLGAGADRIVSTFSELLDSVETRLCGARSAGAPDAASHQDAVRPPVTRDATAASSG